MAEKPRYCINGRFLTRRVTGVDRYARELVRGLDGILSKGEAVILLPEGCEPIGLDPMENIVLRNYGKHRGAIWEQFDLSRYARKRGLLVVNLCNTAPVRSPGVVCVHDVNVRANPSFWDWKFRTYYLLLFSVLMRRAKAIVTVSRFSESEITKYYPAALGKTAIIPNAWQHIERVQEDTSALAKYSLEPGDYYFAMSSLAPSKNLKWIAETAKLNPDCIFAVAGGINTAIFGDREIPRTDNVRYLGYVSDGEAKSLMKNCKAFLYPTLYEGFGIPPMEAMAVGVHRIIVSDIPCMHEIYGDSVAYINPMAPCQSIDKVKAKSAEACKSILKCFDWRISAICLLEVLSACLDGRPNSQESKRC